MTEPRQFRNVRTLGLVQSEIRRMTRECERVRGINLGQGVCDLPTPPPVRDGVIAAVSAGRSTYSKFEGIDELRSAIAAKARAYNCLERVDPATDVVVTAGATGAFVCAVHALFNPGDEILVFEPYYGYHVHILEVAGLTPVFVPMQAPRWMFSPDGLERVVTPRTRGIIVNTPANPSGKVFSQAELEVLAQFCLRHDLLALTDEIYEYIVYDGHRHLSLAALPGMWERTVTISGFSKTFSVTGWRLGYAIAPAALAGPIGLLNDVYYICAPTPLQYGVAEGMGKLGPDYYTAMAADYQRKRDRLCDALAKAGLPPLVPDGAYYTLADVSRLGCPDARTAAMLLLERTGVAAVAGSAFFTDGQGENLLRFCYAKDWAMLDEACRRLAAGRV